MSAIDGLTRNLVSLMLELQEERAKLAELERQLATRDLVSRLERELAGERAKRAELERRLAGGR